MHTSCIWTDADVIGNSNAALYMEMILGLDCACILRVFLNIGFWANLAKRLILGKTVLVLCVFLVTIRSFSKCAALTGVAEK